MSNSQLERQDSSSSTFAEARKSGHLAVDQVQLMDMRSDDEGPAPYPGSKLGHNSDYRSGSFVEGEDEKRDNDKPAWLLATKDWLHKYLKWIFCIVLFAYMVAACVLSSRRDNFNDSICLIIIFILYLLKRIGKTFHEPIKSLVRGPYQKIHVHFDPEVHQKRRKIFMWTVFACFMVFFILYVGLAIVKPLDEPIRFMGLLGLIVLYGIGFVFCKHKRAIRARPIVASLILEICVGLLVMRTDFGFQFVKWLSDTMTAFLSFVRNGSEFVFGASAIITDPTFVELTVPGTLTTNKVFGIEGNPGGLMPNTTPANAIHYFGLMVIPTVIYVGAFTSMLYHTKLIQPVIKGLGWAFGGILGTTTPESVNAAGNIFLGQTEAPLIVKPFIGEMSTSEIHAVCVGGFATVSGSVMGAYIGVGVNAGLLISSVVMSSAGSLGIAKLLWPETDPEKKIKDANVGKKLSEVMYADRGHCNVIEAAAAGAADTLPLALNIGAMLLSFLSIIAMFNSLLNWICAMVDIHGPDNQKITIEFILGYIFYPIVYCMGVTDSRETLLIGRLLGLKLMATEMTAYIKLGPMLKNAKWCDKLDACLAVAGGNCAEWLPPSKTACDRSNYLSQRAITIISYALCGFGNFGSVGILIGGLTPLAPHKRTNITSSISRALLAGLITNLIVATIAGLVYDPDRQFT